MGFLGSLAAGHRGAARARPRRPPWRHHRGGPAHRRARVLVDRDPDLRRRCGRDPRPPRPARALARARRRRPCSTASGTSPTAAARARRASTTCSPRPRTSPRPRRAPSAPCSGSGSEWGRPLVIALAALLVLAIRRGVADPWRLAALIALPLVFWGLTGIARADLHEPAAPRYLYPGARLPAADRRRGGARHARLRAARRRRSLVLLAFVTRRQPRHAAQRRGLPARPARPSSTGRSPRCSSPRRTGCRPGSARSRTVAPQIDAALVPRRGQGPRLARARAGRAAAPVRAQPREPPTGRCAAAYGVALAPAPGGPKGAPPATERVDGATATPRGACLRAQPQAPAGSLELAVPPAGPARAPTAARAKVFLRRFADGFRRGRGRRGRGRRRADALRIPGDALDGAVAGATLAGLSGPRARVRAGSGERQLRLGRGRAAGGNARSAERQRSSVVGPNLVRGTLVPLSAVRRSLASP